MKTNLLVTLAIVTALILAGLYFGSVQARGYHPPTIIENNTYVDKSSEAMGACALGQAASQFHPSIFSKHHQYGVGAGVCDGDTSEQAVNLGYARVINKRKTHVDMFSINLGRSTDNVTALGIGWNSHFD